MDAGEIALARSEIANVLSRYYQALDRGDLATLEERVIDVDATWRLEQRCGDERLVDETTGREAIVGWFRRMLGAGVTMTEGTVRHHLDTHVIDVEVDGEGGRGHSTSHLLAVDTAEMKVVASGFAEADHVRTASGWRIRRYAVVETITKADMEALRATFHA